MNFDIHVFRTRDDLWCARIEGVGDGRLYTQRRALLYDVLLETANIITAANNRGVFGPLGSPELDPRTERGLSNTIPAGHEGGVDPATGKLYLRAPGEGWRPAADATGKPEDMP